MKGFKRLTVTLVFVLTLFSGTSAAFAYNARPVAIQGVEVYIDGTELATRGGFYNFNNGTLVPMRELFEGLGASLVWDEDTKTILAKTQGRTIKLRINQKTAQINGKNKVLSVEPRIINNHTYVPLRFIAEALQYDVDWNGQHKIISIKDKKGKKVKKDISKSDVYKSSQFFKENYINITINDGNLIEVKGRIAKEKTGWIFVINGEDEEEIKKRFKMKDKNKYAGSFVLDSKLKEGDYTVSMYFGEGTDTTYHSYYGAIPLKCENGKLFFPVPSVYPHNHSEFQKNAVLNPENYRDVSVKTESQQAQMVEAAGQITKGARTEYEKVFKIGNWVSQNIYYDYDGLKLGTLERPGTYGTFSGKKAVCLGYAQLTQELLRAVGIPARIIFGRALGGDEFGKSWEEVNHQKANHAWNEAFVDGRWVILDTTWNSKNRYEDGKFKKNPMQYNYFDPDLKFLSQTHKIIAIGK